MKSFRKNLIDAAVALAVAQLGSSVEKMVGKQVPWATYNYQGGVLGGTASGPTYSTGRLTIAEVKLDFAAIAAARAAASQAALGNADVLQILGVPAGVYVPYVAAQTSVVEGAVATVSVGDGNNASGFILNHDLNALGRTASLVVQAYSVAVGGGVWYNVDDTLDVTLNNAAIDTATLSIYAALTDLRKTR